LNGKPPVVCYYGVQDKADTICADPNLPPWIKVYEKTGDHHFDYNYEGLARQMIDDLPAAH
jgi:type IV secretory pathway VirJ component